MTLAGSLLPVVPEALVGPLRDLSASYHSIAERLDAIVAEAGERQGGPRDRSSPRLRPQRGRTNPGTVQVDLKGAEADVLDVIDRIASCEGIEDMSVTSVEGGSALILVRIRAATGGLDRDGEGESMVVVCARCDRLVSYGEVKVSHGLCDACAEQLRAGAREP